jgi:Transcriptional activator of glycolytic enzymes
VFVFLDNVLTHLCLTSATTEPQMKDCMHGLLENFGSQQRLELANQFISVGVGLATTNQVRRKVATEAATNPSPPSPSAAVVAREEDEFQRVLRHPLKSRHEPRSATAVYEEYYGQGSFVGMPIEGGLKGLDDKYKTKWRKGDPAYQKAFSRIQQVVSCVDHRMKEESKEKEAVLSELDELFDAKKSRTLAKMVEELQQTGWLPKRGRSIRQEGALHNVV